MKTWTKKLALPLAFILVGFAVWLVKEEIRQPDSTRTAPQVTVNSNPPPEPEPIWKVQRYEGIKIRLDTLYVGAYRKTGEQEYHSVGFTVDPGYRALLEYLDQRQQKFHVVFKQCIENCPEGSIFGPYDNALFEAILADISGWVVAASDYFLLLDTRSPLGTIGIKAGMSEWPLWPIGSEHTIQDVKIYLGAHEAGSAELLPAQLYVGEWDPWPRVAVKTKP